MRKLTNQELVSFWGQMVHAQGMQSEEIDMWEGWGEHSEEYMYACDQMDWYQFQVDAECEQEIKELQCDDLWEDAESFRRENDMHKF